LKVRGSLANGKVHIALTRQGTWRTASSDLVLSDGTVIGLVP
jgi:hypothetical protein